MKKPPIKVSTTTTPPKKRKVSSTVFSKEHPSPHAFKPRDPETGEIDPRINREGKPKNQTTLLSRSLREQLAAPAPKEVAEGLGLGRNASWSACITTYLLRASLSRDTFLQAIEIIGRLTEPKGPQTAIGIAFAEDAETGHVGPKIDVHFVTSDGTGRMSEESQRMCDALDRGESYLPPTVNGTLRPVAKLRTPALMLGCEE